MRYKAIVVFDFETDLRTISEVEESVIAMLFPLETRASLEHRDIGVEVVEVVPL